MEDKLTHQFGLRLTEDEHKLYAELPNMTRTKLNVAVRELIRKVINRPHCPVCGSRIGQCVPHKQVAILELKPEPTRNVTPSDETETDSQTEGKS